MKCGNWQGVETTIWLLIGPNHNHELGSDRILIQDLSLTDEVRPYEEDTKKPRA